MSKKAVYTREIWMCNFDNIDKNLNSNIIHGSHFVLVLDSYKFLSKENRVHVSPITSQDVDKIYRNQVKLEEFGLNKPSKVMLEQIFTVDKNSDLIFKIGKIDDILVNKQIDEKLKNMIVFDSEGKLNRNNILDTFKDKLAAKKDIKRFNDLIKEIRTLYYRDYLSNEIENLAYQLINGAKTSNLSRKDKNDFIWYGYYTLALINYQAALVNETIPFIEEGLKYTNLDIVDEKDHYGLLMWLLGNCYENDSYDSFADVNKAIDIFETLSKHYRNMNDFKKRTSVVFNIAYLKKNIRAMELVKSLIENHGDNTWYNNVSKEEVLKNAEQEMRKVKDYLNVG